jgi:hypothetical protein
MASGLGGAASSPVAVVQQGAPPSLMVMDANRVPHAMAASRARLWYTGSNDPDSGSPVAAAGPLGARSMDGKFIGLAFPVAQLSWFGACASYVFG